MVGECWDHRWGVNTPIGVQFPCLNNDAQTYECKWQTGNAPQFQGLTHEYVYIYISGIKRRVQWSSMCSLELKRVNQRVKNERFLILTRQNNVNFQHTLPLTKRQADIKQHESHLCFRFFAKKGKSSKMASEEFLQTEKYMITTRLMHMLCCCCQT